MPKLGATLFLLLFAACQPLRGQTIRVGPTVTISTDAPTDPHGESFFAVNPKNPQNQIAASCRISDSGPGVSGYVTFDNGRTWSRMALPAEVTDGRWDVITYFDGEGEAFFAANDRDGLWITHSTDGGHTWSPAMLLQGIKGFDRQFMAFDTTGRFAGRIYAGATGSSIGLDGKTHGVHAIAFSTDGGKTFSQPHLITGSDRENIFDMVNILVSPDGTVIVPFWTSEMPKGVQATLFSPRGADRVITEQRFLRVAISGDGGNTYSISAPIATSQQSFSGKNSFENMEVQGNGYAAIDLSHGPFRGRIYVEWVETSGVRHDVRVIHSSDNGKTWSSPATVEDDTGPVNDANPTIAVNDKGVVGVTWNDRRNHKDSCYDLYFSASLDGGQTFLPNVSTGQKPTCPLAPGNWKPSAGIRPYHQTENGASVIGQGLNVLMISTRFPGGGDTQGLGSDANGVFHAAWIDGASGVMQLATTSFSVSGEVHLAKPPGRDVSTQVRLVAKDCGFDWKANTFSCQMHLENISPLPVKGPFAVELENMRVNLTGFHVLNADNHEKAEGARWTFPAPELAPRAQSESRVFQWQFAGLPPQPAYPFMMFKIVSVSAPVAGNTAAASGTK